MKTYPLKSISLKQAMNKQYKLVDCMLHNFEGHELLTRGDLGVNPQFNKPIFTDKVEKTIAQFFNSEEAILVRGAGTGAIRYGLTAMVKPNTKILIHDAPIYPSTKTSFEMFSLNLIKANFNDLNDIKKAMDENPDIKYALIQYSRQKIDDSYDIKKVIKTIKNIKNIPIITDDNYVVMKVDKIGVEVNADLSCFSSFKLQGPEGIGCIVGKSKYIKEVRKMHYSGGSQVQGHEALDVLRGLVYAPVSLAIQAMNATEVVDRLNKNEVKGIKSACIANAQSKIILIEFNKPIARRVLEKAEKHGALPYPVGAESKYEIAPLFYRVSGTFLESNPSLRDTMIRVNPNRASADSVIEILKKSIKEVIR